MIRPTAAGLPHGQRGVSLIEVLIAAVVLSFGLLGLIGLHTVSLQLNQGAVVRSQASLLAYDITDRIRANWRAADAYNLAIGDPTPAAGDLTATDLNDWRTALDAMLPGGTGSVEVAGGRVTVVIRWLDSGDDDTDFERDQQRTFEFRTAL